MYSVHYNQYREPAPGSFFRMHGNTENLPLAAPYERMAIKKKSFTLSHLRLYTGTDRQDLPAVFRRYRHKFRVRSE